MKFPVDSYDLKARYAPGLIISIPVLITFWACFYPEFEKLSKLWGGILSAVIIYALSVLVRSFGKKIEPKLWDSWGGMPSTIIVSWSNDRLGESLKAKYHQAVIINEKLPMLSKEEEMDKPAEAAKLINQAFTRIKGLIRKYDNDGLWFTANTEYGFARNLLGSRVAWLLISMSATIGTGLFLFFNLSSHILVGFILNLLVLIFCLLFGWLVLPGFTKQAGFRYAEHAWESYYNIIKGKE